MYSVVSKGFNQGVNRLGENLRSDVIWLCFVSPQTFFLYVIPSQVLIDLSLSFHKHKKNN